MTLELSIFFVVVIFIVWIAYWIGYDQGHDAGFAKGYRDASDIWHSRAKSKIISNKFYEEMDKLEKEHEQRI